MENRPAETHSCPVCGVAAPLLDVVDFNKSCEELRGSFLPLAGVPVYYALCDRCGFAFAPQLHGWTLEEFSQKIYNDDYALVDPDYLEARPSANASYLRTLLGAACDGIRHLDYGGGHGLLSDLLRDAGWNSGSYDPFVDRDTKVEDLGRYDLVTAFEVFEHVPDVRRLVADLSHLVADDGVVLFSTLVSDGNVQRRQRLIWWYASPRNGHISLHSRASLALLGECEGFRLGSFSSNFHAYWKRVPAWARGFLKD